MENKICDFHIHTKYSIDSKVDLEEYCIEAKKKNIDTICFTEHIDYNRKDPRYGFYNKERFFEEFNYLKEKYKDQIELLCGIEFSEPHLYKKQLDELSKLPYDFIIGSVHYWYNDLLPSQMVTCDLPIGDSFKLYWEEVLKAVQIGGFDCLGHMDFPKRYYNKLIYEEEMIKKICIEMVKNNICLEINTSSLRRGNVDVIPSHNILSIYKACGGKYVTVGSDSHRAIDLGADNEIAKRIIKIFDFEEVKFIKRVPYKIHS